MLNYKNNKKSLANTMHLKKDTKLQYLSFVKINFPQHLTSAKRSDGTITANFEADKPIELHKCTISASVSSRYTDERGHWYDVLGWTGSLSITVGNELCSASLDGPGSYGKQYTGTVTTEALAGVKPGDTVRVNGWITLYYGAKSHGTGSEPLKLYAEGTATLNSNYTASISLTLR